jgi:tRNA pseudouridine13 synthase
VKDRRAQTTQLFSIEDVEQSRIDALNIPGVRICVIGQRGRRIYLGEHRGNRFSILVRGCGLSGQELACNIENTTEEIRKAGGIANYFGIQRFGVQRPVNHAIGRLIVQGDLQGALMEFLTRTSTAEWDVARSAREQLASDIDFKGALDKFPVSLRYERAVLHHLATHKSDWEGALAALGALGEVFVHAYQSYLFNRALSYRLRADIGLNEPLRGDSVVPLDEDGIPRWKRLQNADASNTDTDFLLRRGRLAVAWPLVGTETVLPGNDAAEHYNRVLEEENVNTENFHIPVADELSSRGGWRALHAAQGDFNFGLEGKEENDLRLEFFLPKGSYATVLLREYMKEDPLSMH